jgi:8-hydroxy-5-deazaflavin:NADPH oxidoreductase
MKKIGILGSGDVGKSLASGFIKHGYQVMIGTRTSSKLDEWKKQFKENLTVGSFSETASFGEIIILATKGSISTDALRLAGIENLKGKTIIDATNPIADLAPENGVLRFFTTLDKSLMETFQSEFPQANFVKAFNSVGSGFMVNPDFGGIKPSMPICGNNPKAKEEVSKILNLFGWETIDMGMIESARAIEPLCMLWCIPGLRENKWSHAFKLLRK